MSTQYPEIKCMISPDLEYGIPPKDAENCAVFIEIEIGIKGKEGADIFSFTVITPKAIEARNEKFWGKGYLITPSFSWKETEKTLQSLMMHCTGENWSIIASKLNKELGWEFEGYQQ